jgi:hypothetical protein
VKNRQGEKNTKSVVDPKNRSIKFRKKIEKKFYILLNGSPERFLLAVGGVVEGFMLPLLLPFNAGGSLTITPVPFSDFICIVMVNKLCFQTTFREFYAKKGQWQKKSINIQKMFLRANR